MSSIMARPKKMIKTEEKAVTSSETIKRMMEDGLSPFCIPVASVKAQTLAKVVEYWLCRPTATSKGHRKGDEDDARRKLGMWVEEFVNMDLEALFELGEAARLLEDRTGPLFEITLPACAAGIMY